MSRMDGKVALITGAASGLGAASALRFAQEGAVLAGFDLNEAEGGDWATATALAKDSLFEAGDVRDADAIAAFVARVREHFGRIDVLVNSAGVGAGGYVHLLEPEEWDRVIDINLKGTFLFCRAVLPAMIEQKSGSIINLASVEGVEGMELTSAYNASKGGVVLLTKNMAIDYARQGIRVNCICPGFIDTPLLQDVFGNPEMKVIQDKVKDAHMLGRLGKPVEIANAALFLACEESSFVTGHSLVVDGGFTAGHRFGIGKMLGFE
ncbi:MAG: SDR family oxidoreductase [Deltaproteobacteria bacterium]|nr:SDR family oxidoreductase [Deltaproteobacteria bacterium]